MIAAPTSTINTDHPKEPDYMPDDMWSNDYSHAGKGHRDRMRQEQTSPKKAKTKERSEHRRNRKPQKEEREQHGVTVSGMKRKIILYTIQLDSFFDVYERLDREGYGVASKVAVSGVRNSTLDVIKTMLAEGLITQEQLDQYRKRKAKEQRERFKRKSPAPVSNEKGRGQGRSRST